MIIIMKVNITTMIINNIIMIIIININNNVIIFILILIVIIGIISQNMITKLIWCNDYKLYVYLYDSGLSLLYRL